MANQGVVILAATPMEIEPLLNQAEIKGKTLSSAGRAMIDIDVKGQGARVVITGPGMVNTAQALTETLEGFKTEKFKPALVVQTGIAGVFDKAGLKPGDVGIADSETYVHTGLEDPLSPHGLSPLPFDLLESNGESRKGRFPVNQKIADHALTVLKQGFSQKKCRVVKAGFITVSTITATDATAQRLFSTYHPCMEAMEGAASAQIAALYNINFMEVRGGSNRVGIRDKQLWNIPLAAQRASRAVYLYLKVCDFKPVQL